MGYRTQSSDTSEVVERLQFDHLRRMGRKGRWERGLARVDESLEMMWRAFVRRYPDASPEQLHVEWVRIQFGDELAARVEEFLKCHQPANIEMPFAAR